MKQLLPKLRQTGDTIVEVMISMIVLSIVLGAAYAVSTRAFQTGLNAQYRAQAASYAQQQLEIIKNADNGFGNISIATLKGSGSFCVDTTNLTVATAGSTACKPASQYTVTNTYVPTPSSGSTTGTQTFKTTVQWQSSAGTPQQTVFYYKTHGSFNTTSGAFLPTPTPIITPAPTAGLSFSSPDQGKTLAYGSSTTFDWNANYITPPCTASSSPTTASWNGARGNVTNESNVSVGPINNAGTNTFTLTCPGVGGQSAVSKQLSITISPAPAPITTTNAATGITYNAATLNGTVNPNGVATTYQFKYGPTASYGTTTSAVSAGAGTTAAAVTTSMSGLSASSVYHFQLCATNTNGTTCGSDLSFNTSSNPTPVINSFSASPTSVNYGASSTLSWSSTNATNCLINGTAWVATSGPWNTGSLTSASNTYQLACENSAGVWTGYSYATVTVGPTFTASGGSVSTISGYKIHTFSSSDTFTISSGSGTATVLIVAGGGGGGGGRAGGGGGGGGLIYNNYTLGPGSYSVNIGGGGGPDGNGGNSSVSGLATAIGGGTGNGGSGGSGGGGNYSYNAPGGSGSQGYNGGNGFSGTICGSGWLGGGGGGAGQAGTTGAASASPGGGNGLAYSISGNNTYYGGGGGGGGRCEYHSGGGGGAGGGGGGGSYYGGSGPGSGNTGGGGGGSGTDTGNNATGGSSGGSGIVIIRYNAP